MPSNIEIVRDRVKRKQNMKNKEKQIQNIKDKSCCILYTKSMTYSY